MPESNTTEIAHRESTDMAARPDAAVLSAIAILAKDPNVNPDKLQRLLDMQMQIMAEQRRISFTAALSRLTPKMPAIHKNGRVSYPTKAGGQVEARYAKLEDIDRIIRPLIAEEGFSQSYDTEMASATQVKIIGKLSHAEGHFETKQVTLAVDKSGSKNDAQAVISTIAYGRRILTKMFFNLMEEGEDTDGNNPTLITEDQARDIRSLLTETRSDEKRFLALIAGVERIEDISARDYKRIINALETKRRERK